MTEELFFSLLLNTMFEARRNKRYGRDSSDFERNWAPLLARMMRQLQERTFRVDQNYAFLVSVPKWREIFATFFSGRLADHLLCDTIAPYTEQILHERTFNNRRGMGTTAAINQVIKDIYDVTEGYKKPARIIKWDLKGFFPNALCDEIERHFCNVINANADDIALRFDEEMPAFLKWLTMICIHCCPAQHCERRTPTHFWCDYIDPEKSLFSKPPSVGTPIGRLPSQIGMGLYLNDEVVWINEDCGIRATLFMDDCVMVVPESLHQYALSLFSVLRARLAKKGIRLNERKFYDQPARHGLEFLGYHVKPYRMHLNNRTYYRACRRIRELNTELGLAKSFEEKCHLFDCFVSSLNSYAGMLKGCEDYTRLQRLVSLALPEWWTMCRWNTYRRCAQPLPRYTVRERLRRKYHLRIRRRKHYKPIKQNDYDTD